MNRFFAGAMTAAAICSSGLAWAETATAVLSDTRSEKKIAGQASLSDTDTGLKIAVEVSGAEPGKHGIHIHEFGSCEESGDAAGSHFNPDEVGHGNVLEQSVFDVHPGDLGNIEIGADGKGKLEVEVEDLSLSEGIFNVAGRAIILHEKTDDFGQPSGNAGTRIACGAIYLIKGEEVQEETEAPASQEPEAASVPAATPSAPATTTP